MKMVLSTCFPAYTWEIWNFKKKNAPGIGFLVVLSLWPHGTSRIMEHFATYHDQKQLQLKRKFVPFGSTRMYRCTVLFIQLSFKSNTK